jgi:hypothetical protein
MNALLTAITLWLSANFSLPMVPDHPHVERVPSARIFAILTRGVASDKFTSPAPPYQAGSGSVVSVYDDTAKTIYLPQDWTGATPAELSVLVHEMVHHAQNALGLKYQCMQEREQLAYLAQERWLGLFGRSLASEFEIDAMTLLVRTKCFH